MKSSSILSLRHSISGVRCWEKSFLSRHRKMSPREQTSSCMQLNFFQTGVEHTARHNLWPNRLQCLVEICGRIDFIQSLFFSENTFFSSFKTELHFWKPRNESVGFGLPVAKLQFVMMMKILFYKKWSIDDWRWWWIDCDMSERLQHELFCVKNLIV